MKTSKQNPCLPFPWRSQCSRAVAGLLGNAEVLSEFSVFWSHRRRSAGPTISSKLGLVRLPLWAANNHCTEQLYQPLAVHHNNIKALCLSQGWCSSKRAFPTLQKQAYLPCCPPHKSPGWLEGRWQPGLQRLEGFFSRLQREKLAKYIGHWIVFYLPLCCVSAYKVKKNGLFL